MILVFCHPVFREKLHAIAFMFNDCSFDRNSFKSISFRSFQCKIVVIYALQDFIVYASAWHWKGADGKWLRVDNKMHCQQMKIKSMFAFMTSSELLMPLSAWSLWNSQDTANSPFCWTLRCWRMFRATQLLLDRKPSLVGQKSWA